MTVRRAWRIALAGAALLVFWAAFFAYPPRVTALPHGAWLGFPSPERVLAFATTLAGFLFLNLAVWGAGAWIGRRMPSWSQRSRRDARSSTVSAAAGGWTSIQASPVP